MLLLLSWDSGHQTLETIKKLVPVHVSQLKENAILKYKSEKEFCLFLQMPQTHTLCSTLNSVSEAASKVVHWSLLKLLFPLLGTLKSQRVRMTSSKSI